MTETEHWTKRAEALRDAAREDPAVIELDPAARYETRGRGATVRGLRLREADGHASARAGVVLDEAALREQPVRAVVKRLRTALRERWAAFDRDNGPQDGLQDDPQARELRVHVDVVDLRPSATGGGRAA